MTGLANIIAGILVVAGALFAAIASIGILRFPDFYTRVHAAAKAGAVGSALMLLALAVLSENMAEVLRAIAAIVFFFLTAPISAHLLGKAAYSAGYKLWEGSIMNEMPPSELAHGETAPVPRNDASANEAAIDQPSFGRPRSKRDELADEAAK